MAGLVPAIHVARLGKKVVDARVKPGHDDGVCGRSGASYPVFLNPAEIPLIVS
jgi:hypothetical protein